MKIFAELTDIAATAGQRLHPSSWGWRKPRLYSWVAIVDVVTFRSVSSTPSGNGSRSVSVNVVNSAVLWV